MIDLIPVVLVIFKLFVLGTGMFFAIKWHYDQGPKAQENKKEKRAVLSAAVKLSAVFVLLLLGLLFFTFVLSRRLGLDLSIP